MKYFRVAKWNKFQHYDKPRPPWIKVYTRINEFRESNDWRHLTDHELGQLVRIVAHAAMNENTLPFHAEILRDILGCDKQISLARFVELGVIEVFDSYQDCLSREKSRVLSREKSRENSTAPSAEIRDQRSEGISGKKKESAKAGRPSFLEPAKEVLAHLVKVTGVNYRKTGNIEACLKREGCTVDDCKLVIDYKWIQAGGDPAKQDWVNIVTPWRPSHFSDYLDMAKAGKAESKINKTKPTVF